MKFSGKRLHRHGDCFGVDVAFDIIAKLQYFSSIKAGAKLFFLILQAILRQDKATRQDET